MNEDDVLEQQLRQLEEKFRKFEKEVKKDYQLIADFIQSMPREERLLYFRAGRDMVPDLLRYIKVKLESE